MKLTVRVHLIRHAEVASHRGDVTITPGGRLAAEELGRRLAEETAPGERLAYGFAPTRRARETVDAVAAGLGEGARRKGGTLSTAQGPWELFGLRNPDVYLGGVRVEMVSSAEAFAEQTACVGVGAAEVRESPFFAEFLQAPDRIGYWVAHRAPPGEDADAVAGRMLTFLGSLGALSPDVSRLIAVTHSGPMRAFLRRYLLGHDPGEPEYVERIDLEVGAQGQVSVAFRGLRRSIAAAPGAFE